MSRSKKDADLDVGRMVTADRGANFAHLRDTVEDWRGGDADSAVKLDPRLHIRSIPSLLPSAFDSLYERSFTPRERPYFPVSHCWSALLADGMHQLQQEPDVDEYRELRSRAICDRRLHPAEKMGLRQWLRANSYKPPSYHGPTEELYTRTTDKIKNLAGALGQEIGVNQSALVVACLSVAMVPYDIHGEERDLFRATFNYLIREVSKRKPELKRRFHNAKNESRKMQNSGS